MSINDAALYVNFTIYSLRKIEDGARRTFRLPGNPYSSKEKGTAAKEYLKELGVFFYRDEDTSKAVVIEDDENAAILENDSILNRVGFTAFFSRGILNRETLKIGEWDTPRSKNDEEELKKYKEKNGDTKAWLIWNKEGTVGNLTDTQIMFI